MINSYMTDSDNIFLIKHITKQHYALIMLQITSITTPTQQMKLLGTKEKFSQQFLIFFLDYQKAKQLNS